MRQYFLDDKFFRRLADQSLIVVQVRGSKHILGPRRFQQKTAALGSLRRSGCSGHGQGSSFAVLAVLTSIISFLQKVGGVTNDTVRVDITAAAISRITTTPRPQTSYSTTEPAQS